MSIFRSFLLICLISLTAAFGLIFFGSQVGYEEFRGGYAVLTTDASADDKTVLALLEKGEEYFGGSPVSESSQWVLLDEFDSINRIPLDVYFSRVFYFDPRNDGYAQKLKDIFNDGDKRFFYIPLKTGNWNSSLLDRKFNELLEDIHFTIDYFGIGRPLNLFFLAYAAASFIFLIIYLIGKKHDRRKICIITLVPVFFSLSFFGAAGIVCAALFLAFFIMMKEPLDEFSAVNSASDKYKDFKLFYKEIIMPYKLYWILLPLFAAAFFVIIIFSQIKLMFFGVVFAAAIMVFALSFRISSLSKRSHIRFAPVLIIKRRFPKFNFPLFMLPFIAASLFVLFSAPYMSASYDSSKRFENIIQEQDYLDHLQFQLSFSTRKIGSTASYAAFPGFFFDTDGLPSMEVNAGANHNINTSEYPPFPLKQLMDFFHDINSGQKRNTGGAGGLAEKLSLIVLLLFFIPYLFIKRNNDNSPKGKLDNLKRMTVKNSFVSGLSGSSGKVRFMGINWNKKTLYNERNQLRVQKDA
ncbi:MAG: hypothetical protein FWD47_09070 [Treponema sp.]|nr:hypothetical protein [Treponema sp.]